MVHNSNNKPSGPIPTPAQIKPSVMKPAAPAAKPAVSSAPAPIVAAPTEDALDPLAVAEAAAFGRVDEEGNVFLVGQGTERHVGQYPGVSADEAMSLYIRRFLDIKANIDLFAARLPNLSAKDIDASLDSINESLVEPAVVGDVAGLETQVKQLTERANQRKEELQAQRAAARLEATKARENIVERAEALAAADPRQVQWKKQGQELRELLDEWKTAQRTGMRIDRGVEDQLWKRFAAARSTCDRNRRQFFADLDRTHAEAKAVKEELVKRAQSLANSTKWGETTSAFHDLMDEWKRAGRASRKDDDALWEKFRGAQDTFFQARAADRAQMDAEYEENLKKKLEILEEAEALLPVTDARKAKERLYDILDRWDEAGRVPRQNLREIENRLQAVEQAIRGADESNREQQAPGPALAEGFAAQLRRSIDELEEEIKQAQAKNDTAAEKELTTKLAAQKSWLEQLGD